MQQSRKTCSQIFAVCFFPIFSVHFHYRWCQLRKWIWEGGSSLHAPNPFTVWKEKALKYYIMIRQPGISGDASVEAPLGYPDYTLGGHLDYNPVLDPPL